MTEKPTFFGRYAIIVLMVTFFLVPFAMRGARMAVLGMKNDVRDWLPKGFSETAELAWFRKHFLSEQFVVLSWEGCHGDADDHRYQLFIAKLQPEVPPSVVAAQKAEQAAAEQGTETSESTADENATAAAAPEPAANADEQAARPTRYVHSGDFIGDRLGLYLVHGKNGEFSTYDDWGHRGEKWLRGRLDPNSDGVEECWYYITPDGDLYRWDGVDSPVASAYRHFMRKYSDEPTTGEIVHAFGAVDGKWYHEDPRRLRAQLFKTVTTGPDVYASMTAPGGELGQDERSKAEAKRRLTGMLFGPDGKQTCLVVTLSEAAKHNLHLVLGRGKMGKPRGRLFEIAQESNIAENELRLGGPPVDNVAIDEEGSATLVRLISMTAVLGLCLSMACFRSISATIMVFFCGGISAILTLAMMWWFGSTVDAIAMSMPALVYVLGLSGATHLINYYYDAVDHGGLRGAPERSVAMGWKPNLMCNITTAIGLFSLVTSELIPIQKFGIFAGLGVLTATLIEFTYLPAALQIWPQLRPKRDPNATDDQPWLDKYLGSFWENLAKFIVRYHTAVAVGCVLLIAGTGYGLVYMRTSVNMLRMFHQEAKIIKDYEWLEAHLGELVPMEIIVRVPKETLLPAADVLEAEANRYQELNAQFEAAPDGDEKQNLATALGKLDLVRADRQMQLPFLERMELASRIQKVVQREFGHEGRNNIGRAMCAATFVRDLPEPKGDSSSLLKRGATSKRLEAHRDEFLHSDYLRLDQETEAELWRVSLRVAATKGVDYGVLIHELKDVVEPILSAQERRDDIIKKLIASRADHKYPANSKVLLLGVPAEISQRTAKEPTKNTSAHSAKELETVAASQPAANLDQAEVTPIHQTRIFSETLIDLLTVKRLKVKTFIPGVDEVPANWKDYLASFDCIVLVKDHESFAGFDLRRANKPLIDVRDHAYKAPGANGHLNTAAHRAESNPKLAFATYTGVVPIVYKAQRSLLDSLIQSTFWSFITITPLLMFISRSFSGGLVAMLPNVLPVLMVFGGMGWLGIDVDVGSMMCASIALGVAVDDTIHYLNWYRVELDKLQDRKAAILATYKHCATPTFQAALISGLGLSLFALSTFTPTQRFGYLMLVILWLGVAAELIFFPAILAGPLGLAFKPRKKKVEEETRPQLTLVSPNEPAFEPVTTVEDEPHAVPAPASKAALLNHLRQDNSHRAQR